MKEYTNYVDIASVYRIATIIPSGKNNGGGLRHRSALNDVNVHATDTNEQKAILKATCDDRPMKWVGDVRRLK